MNFIQYLNNLKKHNKKIFILLMLICLIFIENFIVEISDINYIQLSPFTGYGMYSEKIKTKNKYNSFLVIINDNDTINLWKYSQQNRHILCQPLLFYRQMKQNSNYDFRRTFFQDKLTQINPILKNKFDQFTNDSKDSTKFKNWYKRYLEQTTHKKINKYKIYILESKYTFNKNILITDSINFIDYK